jgi:hypothetical protein
VRHDAHRLTGVTELTVRPARKIALAPLQKRTLRTVRLYRKERALPASRDRQ